MADRDVRVHEKAPAGAWRGWVFGCVPVLRRTQPEPSRPQTVLFGRNEPSPGRKPAQRHWPANVRLDAGARPAATPGNEMFAARRLGDFLRCCFRR